MDRPTGSIRFVLNGSEVTAAGVSLADTLANVLRNKFGLTGTKVACSQGRCGACTVLVYDADIKKMKPVNACLFPALRLVDRGAIDGEALVRIQTVEGLSDDERKTCAEALAECNGTQCGFC